MKIIIHDLSEEEAERLLPHSKDTEIIGGGGAIHHCIGCFGCWIKTPGRCVINDRFKTTGEKMSKCDEVIIISRCSYGGFSPFVKNVLDRSISYIHPYFTIRNGEMHHRRRYNNHFSLSAYFYGGDMTGAEKKTAEKLVHANALNFDCTVKKIAFEDKAEAFGGKI